MVYKFGQYRFISVDMNWYRLISLRYIADISVLVLSGKKLPKSQSISTEMSKISVLPISPPIFSKYRLRCFMGQKP